jgi:ABC-type lipoprotein release transport system permease subunit
VLDRTTGGLGLWVRSEWRRGWRSLLGLCLLIALGGGVTLAALGGARRADSAFDRFLDRVSSPVDVAAVGNDFRFDQVNVAWGDLSESIARIPGVRGVTPVSWMGVAYEIDGEPGQFFSVATGPPSGDAPPPGSTIVEGRAADPREANEVTINEEVQRQTRVAVGDRITLRSYASDQFAAFIGNAIEVDRGPQVEVQVTGIHRSAEDVSDNPEGIVLLTPAFHDRYGDQIIHCDCAFWIGARRSDADAIAASLPAVIGEYPLAVQKVDGPVRTRVERSVALEVGALRIAAIVAAIASILVVSQALARHLNGDGSTTPALAAIGATRPAVVRAWAIILLPVALAGAGGSVALATALSTLFPRGLARRAEIDTGVRFDTAAFIGGGAMVLLVTVCLASLAAVVTTRRRRSATVRRARSWGASVSPPAVLGASFAVNPSRDRSRLVAISAIGGLAIALGGAVAVALVDGSTSDVLHTPSAFAADWDVELSRQPDDPDAVIAAAAAEPGIDAFALRLESNSNQFVITGPGGTGLTSPEAYQSLAGSMGPIIEQGRTAAASDDVVLGPAIARSIGADVGDSVTVATGEQGDQVYTVSGIGRISDGDETDLAFFTTPDGLTRLGGPDSTNVNGAFVRLGDIDAAGRARLADLGFVPATPPSRVANLGQIGSVPKLLAVALALLGLGGVIHGLLVAGDRRRGDIAVARALGFTRGQAASTIRWQGFAITAIAVVIGLPLGVVVGKLIWKQIADGVGAVDLVTIPWPVIIVAPLFSLAIITATASIVGRRVARLRTAEVLRSE